MKFKIQNAYSVSARLTPEEMNEMEIDFEALDDRDPETRRFLWQIVRRMRSAGIDLRLDGKVFIEARRAGGELALRFTVLPHKGDRPPQIRLRRKRAGGTALYTGTPADALRAAALLPPSLPVSPFLGEALCGLYIDAPIRGRLRLCLAEFGAVRADPGGTLRAALTEYGCLPG